MKEIKFTAENFNELEFRKKAARNQRQYLNCIKFYSVGYFNNGFSDGTIYVAGENEAVINFLCQKIAGANNICAEICLVSRHNEPESAIAKATLLQKADKNPSQLFIRTKVVTNIEYHYELRKAA